MRKLKHIHLFEDDKWHSAQVDGSFVTQELTDEWKAFKKNKKFADYEEMFNAAYELALKHYQDPDEAAKMTTKLLGEEHGVIESNLPAGAENDPRAPWNERSSEPAVRKPKDSGAKQVLPTGLDGIIWMEKDGGLYEIYMPSLESEQIREIAIDFGAQGYTEPDEDGYGWDTDVTSHKELDSDDVVAWANHNWNELVNGGTIAAPEEYKDTIDMVSTKDPRPEVKKAWHNFDPHKYNNID